MKRIKQNSRASQNSFPVTSLSAVIEYLENKPGWVRSICADIRTLERLRQQLSPAGAARFEQVAKSSEEGSFRAEVEHHVVSLEQVDWGVIEDQVFVVLIDHITDTRNLGAIVRSCAYFGVRTVFVANRRQAPINAAAVETAAGGFAYVDVVEVANLARTLERLKEVGFWIVGTDMNSESYLELKGFYQKVCLVLGSEDKGMSQNIRSKCDRVVTIRGSENGVESLNVSVAAGILLAGLQ